MSGEREESQKHHRYLAEDQVKKFERDGYLVVPDFLPQPVLQVLRSECEARLNGLTPEALTDLGCVFEPIGDSFPDTDPCRTSLETYLRKRGGETVRQFLGNSSRLIEAVADLLETHVDGPVDNIFLFNEQFVVKPPSEGCEFAWHRDEDEQLQMCIFRSPLPYLSVWCPLDDITEQNGALKLISRSSEDAAVFKDEDEMDCVNEDAAAAVAEVLHAKSGTAVFLSSRTLHASMPNVSPHSRRVWDPQFSLEPIKPTAKSTAPLLLACSIDVPT